MLMGGFAPKKMFEVAKFTFSTRLDDADQTSTAELGGVVARQGQMITQQGQMITQLQQGNAAARGKAGSLRGDSITAPGPSFARWRASKSDAEFKGQNGRNGYPVNVQPVTFSRHVDTTSFKLMEKFLKGEPFHSVALVKRKPAGTKAAGEAFLRIDFEDVLIINIDWTDDEPVQETVKFISRVIKLQYRPQLPNGELGVPTPATYAPVPQ
jgi:type VI protein secretion system component Hcp